MGARKKEALVTKRPVVEDWSAGDRIGKTSGAAVRDMRLRAELYGEISVERFVALAIALEDALDVARDIESDSMVVVEELADLLRRADAKRETAEKEQADTESACEEQIADVKRAQETAREEHESDMRDLAATCDEWKRRAELAEHQVTERDAMIAALEKALAHARAINPMKQRRAR